ncbi:MAG: IS1 family transposase [Pyrinomonadaceae bacterium MAG19_C2-C3]|nr:IS1 family transposase [Pyrinomonadaceae bacterium MAG19_C2-C3]
MCYEEVTCPRCSSLNVKKNGITAQEKQRYQCKDCRRQFITDYTNFACKVEVQALVLPMTMNGSGIRDISRVLSISTNTVLRLIRAAAHSTPEPVAPKRIASLEMDEFWSFIQKKKHQRWTWIAFDRERKQVTAFVNGRRTDQSCQRLLKKIGNRRVTRFHTDKWESYTKLLPAKRHTIGKEGTRNIERHNLNFRTHLKRLQRRTICFSKSEEMHDAVIKLYVQHSNHAQHLF